MSDGDTSAQLTRLLMTRYNLRNDGTVTLDTSVTFQAQINPSDFNHSFGITYNKNKAQGAVGIQPRFAAMDEEKVSFAITLDGTGVVPAVPGQPPDVKGQLAQLHKVVYDYVGDRSEAPYVRLLWGTLIFFGRLETLKAGYTLFKPGGDPLRAKVELAFVGAMSKEEERLSTSRASNAQAVRVETARDKETMEQMCTRVYGNPDAYLEVARYNGLTSPRHIKPGMKLAFPNLRA